MSLVHSTAGTDHTCLFLLRGDTVLEYNLYLLFTVCVVLVWCLCGVCVVFVWCLCGVCVVFVWSTPQRALTTPASSY